jgi:P4 family phage/plasmid primase-like protien
MSDSEIGQALQVAEQLANIGIPIFVARAAAESDGEHWLKLGFVLPAAWQETPRGTLAWRETWRPGDALCAVMGHGIDLIDVDPRSGGTIPDGFPLPTLYAVAATPSGGVHGFVASLGVGSRDGVFPGVDIKGGGDPEKKGGGHGFAFIAPTVKLSKTTGQPAGYRWVTSPDIAGIQASYHDTSGAALAAHVRELKAKSGTKTGQKADTAGLTEGLAAWAGQREAHSAAAADRAIRAKLDEVAKAPAQTGTGFRETLMRAAMTLGGYVGAGYLAEDEAFDELAGAVRECWGGVDENDYLWIQQGLADGARPENRFAVYHPHEAITGPAAGPSSDEVERKHTFYDVIGTHPFDPSQDDSDQGLADAVIARCQPGLRRGVDTGGWLVRGPERWEELKNEGRAEWAISVLARLMPAGRPAPAGEEKDEAHWQHERRKKFLTSRTAGAISSKMRAITSGADHPAVVRVAELDSEAEVLWAGGLPWDLRQSGEVPVLAQLDPGAPHLHTALTAPELVPTPAWDAFIATVWPDPEVRAWVLRVMSIALTGYPDAALPMLYGPERTGKSSFVSLLAKLLGTYAHAGDPRLLSSTETHASIVYALKGRRMSTIDEGPRKGHLATERLKQLTGGIELTGNAMRENPITFAPTHTLVMTTNDEPVISDGALRSRARIIPCEADQDAVRAARQAITPDVWKLEAPGVLAAMMRETAAWLDDRSSALSAAAPVTVREMVTELAAEQDPFARWLSERTAPDATGTQSRALYAAFAAWWETAPAFKRLHLPSETAYGRSMTRLGYPPVKRMDANYRQLRIVSGDSAAWGLGSSPGGLMAGSRTVDAKPPMPEPSRSTPGSGVVMEGMEGKTPSTTVQRSTPSTTVQPSNEVCASSLHEPTMPPLGSGGSETILCPRCGVAPGVTAAGKLRAHRLADKNKCEGSGDRAPGVLTKSERDRAAKVAAAEGEWIGLPAAMRRGEEPRAVTVAELPGILAECLRRNGGILAVDVENTARPIGHPDFRVQSVQLGDWAEGVDLDPNVPEQAEIIRAALAGAAELNAHNATADLAPLAYLGLGDYRAMFDKMVDTAVRMKLADPASVGNEAGLKDLSPAVLGAAAVSPGADEARKALFTAAGWLTEVKPDTPPEKNGWARVKPGCATMVRYAISDVLDCAAIRHRIPAPETAVERRERRVQVITAPTAYAGVPLDAGQVSGQIAEREPVIEDLGARLAAGGLANARSPKQVTEAFTARGVTIPDSTKFTMQKLVALHPDEGVKAMAADVLAYRKAATFMSTFLVPWREQCERGDGVIRPTIYTLGADTGRMSSVRPNAQNLPKKGGARECWVAGLGKKIIRADMSSVEVRVIAALSQDPQLMAMLANGLKLHDQIAEQVFGPGYTETQRGWAKNGVFAHFFGAGLEKLAATIQAPLEVAAAVVEALGVVAPGVAAWADQVKQAVRGGMNQFRTYSGRIIHLDTSQPHKAVNYLVQGTARELLVDTLLAWDDGPYAGGVIVPVHDEVIAWVDEADAEAATEYLVRCMTRELYGVAITCEPDAPSDRWDSYAS